VSYPRSQTPARIVALLEERGPMMRQEIASALGLAASGINDYLHRVGDAIERQRLTLQGAPVLYRLRGDARPFTPPPRMAATRCTCGDCLSCDVQGMRRDLAARRSAPPPPRSETRLVRGLPVFAEGPGDRDETCVEYTGCLDRFTRSSVATRAHCPTDCTERRRVDWRIERDEHAGRRDASALTF